MAIFDWPPGAMLEVDSDGYRVVQHDALYRIEDGNLNIVGTGFDTIVSNEGTEISWSSRPILDSLNKEKEMSRGLYVVTVVDPNRGAIIETTVIARSEIGALMKVWSTEPDLLEVEYDDCDVRVKREMLVREAKSDS